MLIPSDFDPVTVRNLDAVKELVIQKFLAGLVYRSDIYRENAGYYGDVYTKITQTVAAGLVIVALGPTPVPPLTDAQKEALAAAQVMAAVAFRLNNTISLPIEDEGSQDERGYFSSRLEWEELAKDVLNEFYPSPGTSGSFTNSFIVTDRVLMDWSGCGRPFADETFALMGSRGCFRPYRPYLIGAIGNGWY